MNRAAKPSRPAELVRTFIDASSLLEQAKELHARNKLDAALQMAEQGLALLAPLAPHETPHQKAMLADLVADLAAEMGQGERALRAAELAFRSGPSLKIYRKIHNLAGERWETLKPELLKNLRKTQAHFDDAKIDIFLHEGLIDDAIMVVQERQYYEATLTQVMDAALATRPDWVIKAAAAQAERIIDARKAQHYDATIPWLRRVRDAYCADGRQADWQAYISGIRTTHRRKRKLMRWLKGL